MPPSKVERVHRNGGHAEKKAVHAEDGQVSGHLKIQGDHRVKGQRRSHAPRDRVVREDQPRVERGSEKGVALQFGTAADALNGGGLKVKKEKIERADTPPQGVPVAARAQVVVEAPAGPVPAWVSLNVPGRESLKFEAGDRDVVFGRAELSPNGEVNQHMSRQHFTIRQRWDAKKGEYQYWIMDGYHKNKEHHASRGGTFVDGKALETGMWTPLANGSVIKAGGTEIPFGEKIISGNSVFVPQDASALVIEVPGKGSVEISYDGHSGYRVKNNSEDINVSLWPAKSSEKYPVTPGLDIAAGGEGVYNLQIGQTRYTLTIPSRSEGDGIVMKDYRDVLPESSSNDLPAASGEIDGK